MLYVENNPGNIHLMDINLTGMNGVQALKRLQKTEETKGIPIIAVTSNTMPKDVKRA